MGKIYAIADLHGRYDLFQQVKNFLSPQDTVYVLGDCGDRGKDGWKIIKEVYENPQFIYIKGNHEALLADAMMGDKSLCFYNGGKSTYRAWKYKDGGDMRWVSRLKKLPFEQIYINKNGQRIVMCHAGYTPHLEQNLIEDDYLWDRTHFNAQWDMNFVDTFMIHGHTSLLYFDEYSYNCDWKVGDGAYWYSPDDEGINHKCNIDCGSAYTHQAILLDLDTLESIIFKVKKP